MKWKQLNSIGIISFVGLMAFLLIKGTVINEIKLNKSYRYTICIVAEIEAVGTGRSLATIVYLFNDKQYKGFYEVDRIDKSLIGIRHFIKFYPKNPNNSEVIFDRDVPDSLIEIPSEGWKKIP